MQKRRHLDHQNPIGPHVGFSEHPKSTGSSFSILKCQFTVGVPHFQISPSEPLECVICLIFPLENQPVGESIDFKKVQNLMIPQ